MDMTTTRARRGLFPQTPSRNYMQIIRRIRGYKNIPEKDGTLKSHAMAYSVPSLYLYIRWQICRKYAANMRTRQSISQSATGTTISDDVN